MKAKVMKKKRNARIDTESFMQRFIVATGGEAEAQGKSGNTHVKFVHRFNLI